jgi:two-component system, cell cycle response regulator CtrA
VFPLELTNARSPRRRRSDNVAQHRTDADACQPQRLCTDLGEEGVDLAKLYDYDLILLDLNLPDMHGHDVLRQLRLAKVDTPILILSGSDDTESKIKGFGFGADDYLTKPFHREELVARIHAIIRRSKGHAQSVIRTGKIAVNLDAKTVEVEGKAVHLTGKEYQMLELLSLRKGTTLTKEMFLNHLYGGMDEPELKIIDVFICKLRKKLAEATEGGTTTSRRSGAAATCCATPARAPGLAAGGQRLTDPVEQSPLDLPPRRSYHFGSQARRDPWGEGVPSLPVEELTEAEAGGTRPARGRDRAANRAYHAEDAPEITDADYDALKGATPRSRRAFPR